ncbi:VENN motif pre-toxin domain-containing protein [Escherichia coli]|nr:VENN motif pre-toxin domain-containing protein [Escherichia coli]
MHQPPVRFTYRLLSYLISTIIAGQPLLPAVGAVITPQNGAGMDKAANGVPVVNIATPNGAGISHNRFTDYNVGKEGLILNNATGKLNPTQLGGLIQNNPNLKAGGEAKGIINEVTGGNRSLLQGYTEVAGKAANVMVANPYGITCDGCGFINTPHATLTTGKPVMNADGSLQALEVTEGSITINGAGLDGTRSDAVSIIARATEVNAALHAKDLTVTAGANRITADGRVSALKGEGDVPKVAVDTGALGGMYARRIHLTSTESGVGVNLGNLYAREGDIILNSAGKLVLKNSLAGGNTTVTGTNVSLSGDNKAGGNLSVTGTTGLTLNQSRLVTDKNLVLSSSGQIVQNGGELTAGQNAMLSAQHLNQTSGTVNAAENVTLTTTDDTTLKGRSVAGKTLTVSSGSLNNGGTLVAGRDATVKTGTFSNTGAVQGNGLKVTATDLTSTGSIKSGSTLDISVRNATLSGDAGAKDSARVTVSGTLENRGRLVSDDVLTLSATQINNSGTLSGAKELVVSADTLTTTEKSVTNSDGNLMLNSASSTLAGETSAGGTVSVKGNSLKTTTTAQTQGNSVSVDVQNAQLDGTQAARDILTLNASEKLTHSGKSSAPSLSLSAPELTSSGVLVASALNTQSQTLTNSGLLQGEASLTVNTQRLDNQQNGTLYSAADLTLDIPDIRNSGLITGDTGSDMQRGIQAATAALQGLVGGNMAGALAGASAPELANIIGHHAGIDDNTAAKAIAHAILGGVTAALQGNSAAAGAIGAGTGEVIASAIAKSLYPGVDPSKLTEDQKQTVSTLATLSAGMAGGIASGDVAGAAAGAGAGKNVVENNALSLVARGCAVAAPCRTKVAEQLLEIGAKAGMAGLAGAAVKDMADRMTSDELEHLITLQMMGNDENTTKYLSSLHDKYGSGAASNPNIGKDLTDAEKVELGGSGSGTGTPPPSENDPKQQNEKTVDKLNQKQESAIKKIDNTIKNALKDHDIIGTLKDMDGKPVPKENGGYWDHMQEMQNTLRGLRNHADTLKNVNNPEAQAAYGRATDAINKIESALKGYGI